MREDGTRRRARRLCRLMALLLILQGCGRCREAPEEPPAPGDAEALASAVVAGDQERVVQLLEAGADPNAPLPPTAELRGMLSEARSSARPSRVAKAQQLLILSLPNNLLYHAELTAALDAATRRVRAFALREGHLLLTDEPRALHLAAFHSQDAVAAALLARGADPNAPDGRRFRPLHLATCPEVTEVLIEGGADTEQSGQDGLRPLHVAVTRSVARVLLEHGADLEARDEGGNTPLMTATYLAPGRPRLRAETLASERADPHSRLERLARQVDAFSQRLAGFVDALSEAAMRELDVAGYLEEQGADRSAENLAGLTRADLLEMMVSIDLD